MKPVILGKTVMELIIFIVADRVRPHDFEITLEVTVQPNQLITQLGVTNTGESKFNFQALQHTYIQVPNSGESEECVPVKAINLNGQQYMDQPDNRAIKRQDVEELTITRETDMIFIDAPDQVEVQFTSGFNVMVVKKAWKTDEATRPSDFVVWNPWSAKSAAMTDFGDQEFKEMLCVEPGRVSNWEELLPRASWYLQQALIVTEH